MIGFFRKSGFSAPTAAITGWITAVLIATAQLMPDAPVSDFRLPMFGDDGFLDWDLRGEEARFMKEEQIDLAGMRLSVYDELQPGRVETLIISPQAVFLIESNEIIGNETITVEGDNFFATGKNWRWIGEEKSVEIDGSVKVTFSENLSGILQ